MKIFLLLFLLYLSIFMAQCYSDEDYVDTNCKIQNLRRDYYYGDYYIKSEKEINDTFKGKLLEVPKENIIEIQPDSDDYLTAKIENDDIVFSTTEKFKELDYLTRTDKELKIEISSKFKLICEDETTVFYFKQTVEDTNNHAPFFNRKYYTYKFGMEIRAGFVLTDLLPIFATDVDFSDNKIDFTLEDNKYLSVKDYSTENLRKSHYVTVTTLEKLPKPFTEKIKISAKDKGNKTSEAIIQLIIT